MKITALTSHGIKNLLLTLAVCAAACVFGCGRKQTDPLSEGGENSSFSSNIKPAEFPVEQQIEQKLDPLTTDDIALYLKIMRAAAERIKNPASADVAAVEGARKILAGGASGRVPTPDHVKTLERADLVAISMDQIVAEEMKVDGRTYRGIAEAIESVVPNPTLPKTPGIDGKPAPDHTPTPLENRLSEVNAVNEKFLTPYRNKIQELISIVRNPANLPK
jgi:hypothetical protein